MFDIGRWWSSDGSTIPGSGTSWQTLTQDYSSQSGECTPGSAWGDDTAYPYNKYRKHYNYLITAHWGLKNLKPCVIVWKKEANGADPNTLPTTRPKNWLYRGETLQPGDIYFYIDDTIQ
jgi:hypothetical protein